MFKDNSVLAIIVARRDSQRIKNKALALLGNETLLERKISQLKKSKYIDRIIVGSNCSEILNIASFNGAEVVIREDYYCDESRCTANEMIGNMMEIISDVESSDIILWSHCTNPMITENTYDLAIEDFENGLKNGNDSLLSVLECREHMWNSNYLPANYDPYSEKHTLASELAPYYIQDGGVFVQSYFNMRKNKYFFGNKPKLFQIPIEEYCDINTNLDLEIANLKVKMGKM